MKYAVTGSLGHISKPLIGKLLSEGHEVKVVTSDPAKTSAIMSLGAIAEAGSVTDVGFLKKVFSGVDAVYTMVPPFLGAPDWKAYIAGIGRNYATALRDAEVPYVVNLSSVGADLPDGCGPVSGLHAVEQELNELTSTKVLHVRPGYFYYNFFGNIDMIRNAKIIGGNYGQNTTMVLVHTDDIAAAVADALLKPGFSHKSVRYISGDEKTTDEIAAALGTATGLPDLKWVDFTDDQTRDALVQAGLPPEIAANYTEMGAAIRSGRLFSDYFRSQQKVKGRKSLSDFAGEFSSVFHRKTESVA